MTLLPYLKYVCIVRHYTGATLFQKGDFITSPVDPGVNFELTTEDPLEFDNMRTHADADGTIYFAGNASNYDDWAFPFARARVGVAQKPDFDFNYHGFLFPQNDTSEVLYLADLASHRMKIGPGVVWFPHFHYIQDEAEIPVWEYRFRITPAPGDVPAFSSWVPTVGTQEFKYSGNPMQQIMAFPPVNAWDAGHQTVASLVDVQVRRNDNVVSGDVVGKQFDFHAPFDTALGSGQEFIK